MKMILLAGCALASIALAGCGTVNGAQSGLAPVIDALARAGCSGSFSFSGGASTAAGISPGSANIANAFNGTCDPRNAKPVTSAADVPAAVPVTTTPPK